MLCMPHDHTNIITKLQSNHHTHPLPLPTFLRLLPSPLPLRGAPKAHSPQGRGAEWRRRNCSSVLLVLRTPGGHFPASWGPVRVLGFRSPGGPRNPRQNQASGRLTCLCVDMSPIIAQDPHFQWSKRVPLGLGAGLVEAKAAKVPSIFWGARYRKVHKRFPLSQPHSHPRRGVARATLPPRGCWFPIPPAPR